MSCTDSRAFELVALASAFRNPRGRAFLVEFFPQSVVEIYGANPDTARDGIRPFIIRWDPDEAFGEAVQAQEENGGLLGDGWFRKLRQAVLTPLRQPTFWHRKNQAREFGERGPLSSCARSWRRLLHAST